MPNTDDNCIEADGSAHDIGVFQNRCFNSTGGALGAQPIFGGPLYFYRNLVYGQTTGGYLKLVDTPAGVLIYQNTFIGQARYSGGRPQCPFPQQPDPGRWLDHGTVCPEDLHQLLRFRLQRLSHHTGSRLFL